MERRGRRNADPDQALNIVAWSTAGGLVIGLIAAVLLAGLWTVVASLVPPLARTGRPIQVAGMAVLALLPVAGAILGYLEGQLKLR